MDKLYLCDPTKNQGCKKTGCQKECFYTTNKEFSVVLGDPGFRMFYCGSCLVDGITTYLVETDSCPVNRCFRCGQKFN